MSKPSLAFIDHSFHQQTHSSDFLRTILGEYFDVHNYWDESWRGGPQVAAETINRHDYAFYLQVMSPLTELRNIAVPITWAPMYDGEKFNYGDWKIRSQFPIKVLSFSKKIAIWAERFGIPVLPVQYYYLPPEHVPLPAGNHILFWYRGGIPLEMVLGVLDPKQIDSFTILDRKDTPQSGDLKISDEVRQQYKIEILQKPFLPREEYLSLLKKCSIFIAPRKKEGIGAFTEALALGKCVIAYNDATHNEYITDGVDGYLFSEKSGVFDLSQAPLLAEAAWQRATKNYQQWLTDQEKILPFIESAVRAKRSALPLICWQLLSKLQILRARSKYYISKFRSL